MLRHARHEGRLERRVRLEAALRGRELERASEAAERGVGVREGGAEAGEVRVERAREELSAHAELLLERAEHRRG